jgi:hypothetical protein
MIKGATTDAFLEAYRHKNLHQSDGLIFDQVLQENAMKSHWQTPTKLSPS